MSNSTMVLFTNFSDEDFSHAHGGMMHSFKAGQEVYLEEEKAHHFAKHLIDRELNKLSEEKNEEIRKKATNLWEANGHYVDLTKNEQMRKEMMKKCLSDISSEDVDEDMPVDVQVKNKNMKSEKTKRASVKKEEQEFAELKEV